MENIVLLGGGGHCISCIEVIEAEKKFKIIGILDPRTPRGIKIEGYPILGNDEIMREIISLNMNVIVTIGQINSPASRIRVYELAKKNGASFPIIIAPSALVSQKSIIGAGTIVMHNAFINSKSVIGDNCIINTGAILEHGSSIGSHCHISTGVIVNGDVKIGDRTFIGSGTVISNGISIADNCVIGAGSLVIKDIIKSGIYIGCPARQK